MTRAEKVAEARRLRDEGLLVREVAERMGVAHGTAWGWLNDPDLSKQRARRGRYSQLCVNCGKPTDGSGGLKNQRSRCISCSRKHQHEERYWTPERIVAAFRAYVEEHGEAPRAREFLSGAPEGFPNCSTVQHECGSWAAAVEAAGCEVRRGRGRTPSEVEADVRETVRLYVEEGLSLVVVGRRMGVSGAAVRHRLRLAGVPRRSPREAARLRFERAAA